MRVHNQTLEAAVGSDLVVAPLAWAHWEDVLAALLEAVMGKTKGQERTVQRCCQGLADVEQNGQEEHILGVQ